VGARLLSSQQEIDQLNHAVVGQTDGDLALAVQHGGRPKHRGIQDPIGKAERNGREPSSLIAHVQRAHSNRRGTSGLVDQLPMPFYCCGSNGKVGRRLADGHAHDTGGCCQRAMAFTDSAANGI
jgi:hypothetical protein